MSRIRAGAVACLPLLLAACGLFDAEAVSTVEDRAASDFVQRIEGFYGSLREVPIPALSTYERPELQDFFTGRPAYDDYFASLAQQVRAATLRSGRIERFEIMEFRLLAPDHASVELKLVGRHQRELRFWDVELPRTDTWRRAAGVWTLSPDRL